MKPFICDYLSSDVKLAIGTGKEMLLQIMDFKLH